MTARGLTLLYTATSGATTLVRRSGDEIEALFTAAEIAALTGGEAITCDGGSALGRVTITRAPHRTVSAPETPGSRPAPRRDMRATPPDMGQTETAPR